MKEVVILEKEEYQNLLDELDELNNYKYHRSNLFKQVYEHDFKNNILVVELDIKKLNKLFYFNEDSEVIILKNK